MSIAALEVSDTQVTLVVARPAGKGVEILRAETAPIGEGGVAAALAKLGKSDRKVILVIPRAKAILREFELPEGTTDEIIQMVGFQVEREFPLPPADMQTTFVETARREGKVQISVAAVPKDVFDPLLETLERAGFKADIVTVSTYGLASLVAGEPDPVAIVGCSGPQAEILVSDRGAVAVSRTAPLPEHGDFEKQIRLEIDRSVMAFQARAEGKEVSRIIVPRSVSELGRNGSLTISTGVTWSLDLTSPVGACLGTVAQGIPLPDLLRPPRVAKRVQIKTSYRVGALLAVIVGLGIFASQRMLSDKEAKLRGLQTDLKRLEPKTVDVRRKEANLRLAREWREDRFPWHEFFIHLSRSKLRPEDLYLESATFGEDGTVKLTGKASSPDKYQAFREELEDLRYLDGVKAKGIRVDDQDSKYRNAFTLEARLKRE